MKPLSYYIDLKDDEEVIEVSKIKEAVKELKKEIKNDSRHQVVNGKANPEYIKYFSEGERIGRENERELVLSIINKIFGERLT
jgi:GTPase SAR1 family protein